MTERDLELVDAVQANPRAAWSAIAEPLGFSAVTAARRWAALAAEGAVWTGAVMGPVLFRGAVVELACRPDAVADLVNALAAMPDVLTVGRTAGESDVYALTAAPTAQALIDSLGERFAGLAAERMRALAYTRVHGGPQWRLNVLNPHSPRRFVLLAGPGGRSPSSCLPTAPSTSRSRTTPGGPTRISQKTCRRRRR